MPPPLFRLSLLQFLQYAVPGSLVPLFSLHLRRLGFSDMAVAACCATQAAAAVVSSLVAGHVADRWLPAEKAVAALAALSGLLLLLIAWLADPAAVFAATLLFWLANGPMVLLGTSVCFTHLPVPEKQFGPVRSWGTVGWMAVGLGAGAWLATGAPVADAFRLGAVVAFVLAGYALALPATPPRAAPAGKASSLAALALLRDEAFLVYALCLLGASLTFPFSTQNAAPLLERLGVPLAWIAPTLTLAQVTEVAALFLLPRILLRLGLKRTMAVGLAAWTLAMLAPALGLPAWAVIASLPLHGLFIAGFLVAGQVYVNGLATGGLRASVQGLFSCVNGLGLLMGNLLTGAVRHATGNDLPATFAVAATLALVMLAAFAARFRMEPGSPSP
ncbi:MAG: MFS transporter [Gemmataceae bacterium]|nr:MFS transporter [Gemmataceae bacterium]